MFPIETFKNTVTPLDTKSSVYAKLILQNVMQRFFCLILQKILGYKRYKTKFKISTCKEEEDRDTTMTMAEIKEMLSLYHKVAKFIESKYPKKIHTNHLLEQFNDICLSHFRNILKRRQKQTSMDCYFSRRPLISQGEGHCDVKKQRRKDTDEN